MRPIWAVGDKAHHRSDGLCAPLAGAAGIYRIVVLLRHSRGNTRGPSNGVDCTIIWRRPICRAA